MLSLTLTNSLMERLRASGISFCHWKSNAHLEQAMLGEGDLDLLIDPADQAKFESVLSELQFIHVRSLGMKRFPGLADFLGFDPTTGELVHLHVHYRLVLGEKVKNHHLPLERWLLGRVRVLDGIPIPRAEDELFLLYLRSIIKSSPRAAARVWLGRTPNPFPASTNKEFMWLAEQAADEEIVEACRASGLGHLQPRLSEFLRRLRTGEVTARYVLQEKHRLMRRLRSYQRYPTAWCVARKVWYGIRHSRAAKRILRPPRKRLDGKGVYTALAGADGSGKTTLGRDLPRWLGWKLESSTVYFGQPKQSLLLIGLRRARRLALSSSSRLERAGMTRTPKAMAACARLANAMLWLHVARYRARLDDKARRRVAEGHAVFAERFPLREFWSMAVPMDGPRLAEGGASVSRRLAQHERRLYERISVPDCVLVLWASLATLHDRKPETPMDEHRAKVAAVAELVGQSRYEVLDAEQPYEVVLLDAKRVVWNQLAGAMAGDQTSASVQS